MSQVASPTYQQCVGVDLQLAGGQQQQIRRRLGVLDVAAIDDPSAPLAAATHATDVRVPARGRLEVAIAHGRVDRAQGQQQLPARRRWAAGSVFSSS